MKPLKEQLLEAIRADPDSDAPRLVYADYLLSQPGINDQRRGRIMAIQCSPGWVDPAQHLSLDRKLRSTIKYLPELIREDIPTTLSRSKLLRCRFERGFLYYAVLDMAEWKRERAHLIPLLPRLGGLQLTGVNDLELEDIEFFRGLSSFEFSELFYSGAALHKLLPACPDAQWEYLNLNNASFNHIPSFPELPRLQRLHLYSRNSSSLPVSALGWLDQLKRLDLYTFVLDAALLLRLPPSLAVVSLNRCILHEDTRDVLGEATFVALYRWLADRSAIRSLSWFGLGEDHRVLLEHPRIASKEIYFYAYPNEPQ